MCLLYPLQLMVDINLLKIACMLPTPRLWHLLLITPVCAHQDNHLHSGLPATCARHRRPASLQRVWAYLFVRVMSQQWPACSLACNSTLCFLFANVTTCRGADWPVPAPSGSPCLCSSNTLNDTSRARSKTSGTEILTGLTNQKDGSPPNFVPLIVTRSDPAVRETLQRVATNDSMGFKVKYRVGRKPCISHFTPTDLAIIRVYVRN
jgi:hypothetical protein